MAPCVIAMGSQRGEVAGTQALAAGIGVRAELGLALEAEEVVDVVVLLQPGAVVRLQRQLKGTRAVADQPLALRTKCVADEIAEPAHIRPAEETGLG